MGSTPLAGRRKVYEISRSADGTRLDLLASVFLVGLITLFCKAFVVSLVASFACGTVRLFLAQGARGSEPLSPEQASRLRKGDVLVFGCRSIFDQAWLQLPTVLVRPLRDRYWVHAGVYGGDGIVWEARGRGVGTASLEKRLAKKKPLQVLRHGYAGERALDEVINYCAARSGQPYAFGAVFYSTFANLLPLSFGWLTAGEHIDRLFSGDGRYTCCELVVEAFAAAGHPISATPGWRVISADLLDSPVLFDPFQTEAGEQTSTRRTLLERAA